MTLALHDYQRYGRQLILDDFGLPAQLQLKQAAVVVVGAGGLGCPALQYLAASGIGRLGIIDHDVVELSNLQRQILHSDATIGTLKAVSAEQAVKRINPNVVVDVHSSHLSSLNASTLLAPYDIILDCTDNAPTRYLLSDTAVRLDKPLVSGAALKFEGQLCVYHLGADGPCYRCLFPKPPAPETLGTCAEGGILGAVTGVIGTLQALEAIKILAGLNHDPPSLLLFSALSTPLFRSIKLRKRVDTCAACGKEGQRIGNIEDVDYVQFCGGERPNYQATGLIHGVGRVTATELRDARAESVIIDVRPRTEFGICSLPNSINVPLAELVSDPARHLPLKHSDVFVVCRLGNDSQIAANALRSVNTNGLTIRDVVGGLQSWSKEVDEGFPVY